MHTNVDEKYQLQQHLNRVSDLSYRVALEMGLSESEAKEVSIAAHIHDVGKLLIYPDT